MTTQHTNQTKLPFELVASFMRGHGKEPPKITEQKKPEEADAFKVVYPIINKEALARMMARYRVYASDYNKAVERENALIAIHNEQVQLFLMEEASELEKAYAKNFPRLNRKLTRNREYNAAVDAACLQYGPVAMKKPIPTLKYQTEQFFQNFLHIYNCQMINDNKEYIRLGNRIPKALRPLKINSCLVTALQREEGVLSLNVCSKTVRNHRQRLEEAGVLVNSTFKGRQRAVEVEISPEILVIWDDFKHRFTSPKNQPVTAVTGKKLPDSNDTTRTFKEEYKEKNDASQSLIDKVSPEATASLHYSGSFYKNTSGKIENSPGRAPAAEKFVPKNLTSRLQDELLHPQELAERLAAGEYDEYTPIPLGLLQHVAYKSTTLKEDFRELVIQDLLKQSAKIWRGKNVFVGSWKNAINNWMQHKFLAYNGTAMAATTVFAYVEEYRWRLEHARRWYLRPKVKVQPLFPSDYFDLTRKTTKEVGFEGTVKMWQRKLKHDETKKGKDLKQKKKAEQRLKRISDNTRYNREIERYLKERITLLQLVEFVRNNLPVEFYNDLPKVLQKKLPPGKLEADIKQLKA